MSGQPVITTRQDRGAREWDALGIVCPRCHGRWRADTSGDVLACAACAAIFPVRCGIPDLRTLGDPYLSNEEDLAAAQQLLSRADALDFAGLFASYYDGNTKVPAAQVVQFTRGVLAASDRAGASLEVWERMSGPLDHDGVVVDLGCGTAPLGCRLAADGQRVVGIDAGLRWLVLARQRAAQAGVDLPVVCANAEALPLADGCLHAVVGESVLENLADPAKGLREAYRVLTRGGSLRLATPNKHSLGPDPHLGVLAGGWWPEARLRARAARDGKVFPVRRLFAMGELDAFLRRAGFRLVRFALPRVARSQRLGLPLAINFAIAGYHLAIRTPILRGLVLRVGPTIVCTATRD